MTKKKKILTAILVIVGIIILIPISFIVYLAAIPGNNVKYGASKVERVDFAPLNGGSLGILGSSVVVGADAFFDGPGDYISKRFGMSLTEEAVIGTTMAGDKKNTYVNRLLKMDKNTHFDLFICQLSTNDATKGFPLGDISTSKNKDDFDLSTTTGAIEFIICYVQETFGCPLMFFTNSRYDSEAYAAAVVRLKELQAKYEFGLIDLYSDDTFNDISSKDRKVYMYDKIHPTRAGYCEWWLPVMEKKIIEYMEEK